MAKIIGVSGKIASGKDYLTGKLIKELHRVGFTTTHTSFATPLKSELNEVISFIRNNPESSNEEIAKLVASEMKMDYEDGELLVNLLREEVTQNLELDSYSRTVAIRTALQDLGTKIRRRQQADYWTTKFLDFVNAAEADFVFTSDARFPNEMDTVVDNKGIALRLDISEETLAARRNSRDGITYTPEQLNHVSETALDDYGRFDILVGESFNTQELVEAILKKAERFQDLSTKIAEVLKANNHEHNLAYRGFPKGVGVTTSEGYKNIEAVKTGDFLLTHQGNYKEVTKVTVRKVSESAYLEAFGTTGIVSTINHPYLVKKTVKSNPEWVHVKDVEEGWFVAHPLNRLFSTNLTESEKVLAALVGVLAQCSTPTLDFDHKPSYITPYFDEKIIELLDAAGVQHKKSGHHLIVQSKQIHNYLKTFGDTKWTKFIPESIHQKPQEWQEAFLQGFLSHSAECEIHSKHLAIGVARIIRNFNPSTDVIISSPAYSEWRVTVLPQQSTHVDGIYVWTPVTHVRTKPELSSMDVYDITVEDDKSFIADGLVVHNGEDV